MKYLSVDQVLRIHARQIDKFGGSPGVKDIGLLKSAVAQPAGRTPAGKYRYPTLAAKAAALAFSLTNNHAFHDGHKRTANAAMVMFLSRNGAKIVAPLEDQEETFLRLAGKEPRLSREGFLAWLLIRITRK